MLLSWCDCVTESYSGRIAHSASEEHRRCMFKCCLIIDVFYERLHLVLAAQFSSYAFTLCTVVHSLPGLPVTAATAEENFHVVLITDVAVTLGMGLHFFRPGAHTHTQPFYGSMDFVRDNPGEPVPEETFTHLHLSWSSIVPYLLLPSNTIHGILPVQSKVINHYAMKFRQEHPLPRKGFLPILVCSHMRRFQIVKLKSIVLLQCHALFEVHDACNGIITCMCSTMFGVQWWYLPVTARQLLESSERRPIQLTGARFLSTTLHCFWLKSELISFLSLFSSACIFLLVHGVALLAIKLAAVSAEEIE